MNKNQNLDSDNLAGVVWARIRKAFKILGMAKISITISLLMFIAFLYVPQAKDAIIALGNFGSFHHYLIFTILGILWALSNWYWPRVFYYMEYHKENGLTQGEITLIKFTPRIIGAFSLFFIGVAFINEALKITKGQSGRGPLITIGVLFLILTVVFLFFVIFRRRLFKMNSIGSTTSSLKEINGIIPFKNLPVITRKTLLWATWISLFFLVIITILPIHSTIVLGDGATILICCFTIWIPGLYWIQYISMKKRIPMFFIVALVIFIFSFFNSNKNVTLVDSKRDQRPTIGQYYDKWYAENGNDEGRTPMVFFLSEGGGIRAAYWSSALLSRLHEELPSLSKYTFGINGVSGGSFGASVYLSLLKHYENTPHMDLKKDNLLQIKAGEVVGKDYLSPLLAAMFTRDVIQLFIPVPIESFDPAKVFEKSWEYHWKKIMKDDGFSAPTLSLWDKNSKIPPLFVNVTRVEDGMPFLVSNLKFDSYEDDSELNLIRDLYNYIPSSTDVKISTAALLSARFPYMTPAGTLRFKNKEGDKKTMGLVDGGYFDNTGANTTYEILMNLKKWEVQQRELKNDKNLSVMRFKPIVIYIKNGTETKDVDSSGKSLMYQLTAPINTIMQTRDAHTKNAVKKIQEYVDLYGGEFIEFALDTKVDGKAEIPLGWALSQTTQEEVIDRVNAIVNTDSLHPDKGFLKLKQSLKD